MPSHRPLSSAGREALTADITNRPRATRQEIALVHDVSPGTVARYAEICGVSAMPKPGPRLSRAQRAALVQDVREGQLAGAEIARKYAVSKQHVSQVRARIAEGKI